MSWIPDNMDTRSVLGRLGGREQQIFLLQNWPRSALIHFLLFVSPRRIVSHMTTLSVEQPEASHSHDDNDDKQNKPLNDDELQIENQLLEQYLKQRNVNVELPSSWSTEPIPTQRHDCLAPVDFKLQIAMESLSQLNNTLETRKEAANKLVSTLKVMLQEAELRVADIQRDAHDLQRDVVEGGKCTNNPERYKAEKFVRYMKGKLYDQESALYKLRLKNNTMANRKKKLEAQLSREDETSFHLIDYHQMQIRQKHNKHILEEKANKVALRKIAQEKTKQRIDALQSQLQDLRSQVRSNEKAVAMREAYLERLDECVYSKEDEVGGLKNVSRIKTIRAKYWRMRLRAQT